MVYRAEPRPGYYSAPGSDRWMGDMAWLIIGLKCHEKMYGSDRYKDVTALLKNLLLGYFKEAGPGGYVQHGWRKGDAYLHEPKEGGHGEGNIDCYAAFRLCGEDAYAERVKAWLESVLNGKSLWLDQYTWRFLAFGPDYAQLLKYPDEDLRFRKTMNVNGLTVVGVFHAPEPGITNIWLDGTGHLACGFMQTPDKERGYFYANQLDKLIIERTIDGAPTHALPYTVNHQGGYDWVDTQRGFISVAAWYIFAKNGFNPMRLDWVEVRSAAP
jgi:hypothetical protein